MKALLRRLYYLFVEEYQVHEVIKKPWPEAEHLIRMTEDMPERLRWHPVWISSSPGRLVHLERRTRIWK